MLFPAKPNGNSCKLHVRPSSGVWRKTIFAGNYLNPGKKMPDCKKEAVNLRRENENLKKLAHRRSPERQTALLETGQPVVQINGDLKDATVRGLNLVLRWELRITTLFKDSGKSRAINIGLQTENSTGVARAFPCTTTIFANKRLKSTFFKGTSESADSDKLPDASFACGMILPLCFVTDILVAHLSYFCAPFQGPSACRPSSSRDDDGVVAVSVRVRVADGRTTNCIFNIHNIPRIRRPNHRVAVSKSRRQILHTGQNSSSSNTNTEHASIKPKGPHAENGKSF